jgi:hypothetical protein
VVTPLDPISGAMPAGTDGVTLPRRFLGDELQASGTVVWALGNLTDSEPALVRLDTRDRGTVVHSRLVTLGAPKDSVVLGTSGHEVLVAVDGELFRVDIR